MCSLEDKPAGQQAAERAAGGREGRDEPEEGRDGRDQRLLRGTRDDAGEHLQGHGDRSARPATRGTGGGSGRARAATRGRPRPRRRRCRRQPMTSAHDRPPQQHGSPAAAAGRVIRSPVAVMSGRADVVHRPVARPGTGGPPGWSRPAGTTEASRPADDRHGHQVGKGDDVAPEQARDRPGQHARTRSAVDTVSSATASIWRPRKFVRRSSGSNSPVQIPVPSRAARAPNSDPRIPIAAGTSTSRPGWAAQLVAPRDQHGPGDQRGQQADPQRPGRGPDRPRLLVPVAADLGRRQAERTQGPHDRVGQAGCGQPRRGARARGDGGGARRPRGASWSSSRPGQRRDGAPVVGGSRPGGRSVGVQDACVASASAEGVQTSRRRGMRRFEKMGVAVVLVLGTAACGGGDGGNAATGDGASATASVDAEVEATGAATTGAVPQAGNLPTDLALPSGIELSGPTLVQSETEFVVTAEIAGRPRLAGQHVGGRPALAGLGGRGRRLPGRHPQPDGHQGRPRRGDHARRHRGREAAADHPGPGGLSGLSTSKCRWVRSAA